MEWACVVTIGEHDGAGEFGMPPVPFIFLIPDSTNMMRDLDRIQRRILGLLEEAGEEHLSALTNTVAISAGDAEELIAMGVALIGLVRAGFLYITNSVNEASPQSAPLDAASAIRLLNNLHAHMEWPSTERLWKRRRDSQCVDVVLTAAGLAVAREILAEDIWPDNPLDRCG